MRIAGKVVPGALTGSSLVEHHFYQIIAEIGYKPYRGTLDIKISKPMNIRKFAAKHVSRRLLDGSEKIDMLLAEVFLIINRGETETKHRCWAVQRASETFNKDIVEIMDRENLRDKYSLNDDDLVYLEFPEK